MARFHLSRTVLGGLFVAAALGLSACDGLNTDASASNELGAMLSSVSNDASLSSTQQAKLSASFSGSARTPGVTWRLADSLAKSLTAEQKAALIARSAGRDTSRFRGLLGHPGAGYLGLGGFIGSSKHFGVSRQDSVLNLTEAQKTQVQALHQSYRDAVKALRESFRSGATTQEAFLRDQLALNAKLQADVTALLTAAQKAALAAFKASKEAEFATYKAQVTAVRDQVLGLTSTQSGQFDSIIAAQLSAREVLVEQFSAGTITLVKFQADVAALEAAKATALQALLTPKQYEVVQIHDALTMHGHGKGFGHGPGVGEKGPGKGHGRGGKDD